MKKLRLLLTTDDDDDCLLFSKPSDEVYDTHASYALTANGVNPLQMPELATPPILKILFAALNIQRKNGSKCADSIGRKPKTSDFPVVAPWTASNRDRVNRTFHQAANNFICDPQSFELLQSAWADVLSSKRKRFVIHHA